MKEKLKAFGFVCIESKPTFKELSCVIGRAGEDRFYTELVIYTDDPGVFYINRHLLSGIKTMSVDDVMQNHNELHNSAKNRLIEFIAEFPTMNCAI